MQTKFYFLLGMLVGFTSFSSNTVAQTFCFGYDTETIGMDDYQLDVEVYASFDGSESSPAIAALAGLTTYRIYLSTPSEMDYVSSVLSDSAESGGLGEVHLSTSTSFFKHDMGGLTPNEINEGVFAFFPDLEFDSFVTVGLATEAGFGDSDILVNGADQWGPAFLAGGDIDISISEPESGWYIPDGASNGYSGEDLKVMIAQITTDGTIGGSFNVEVYPGGDAGESFTYQFDFSSEMCGCNIPSADNYQPGSTLDDGSCIISGCTDAEACNFDDLANLENGTCEYCCDDVDSDNDGYGLEVELYAVGGIHGLRTYRMYVTTAASDDVISAIAGYEAYPLSLATSTDFWQYAGPGGGVTPNDYQPFYSEIPEFADGAYDSYVTIGNTAAPDLGLGESAVTTVNTPGEDWQSAFEAGEDIAISSSSGGAWFLSPGSTSGIAGDDNRVLIGQFTTDGYMSGSLYVQVFPSGDQAASENVYMTFESPLCACTDEAACNYDPEALWDDGTCQDGPAFWGEDWDCEGGCLYDSDGDFVCDADEVEGCLNPTACNYVPPGEVTDLIACIFPDAGYNCDGDCSGDEDGDGVCDLFEIVDCTDATACNYNSDSTTDSDNALCIYPDMYEDCDGNCLSDTDGDGVCDGAEVNGCDDESACNYEASATENDGSCDYCCNSSTEVMGYSISLEEEGETSEGMKYRVYINTPLATDQVSAVTGDSDNGTHVSSTLDFYKSPLNLDVTPNFINEAFFAFEAFADLAYDSWVTIGISQTAGAGEGAISLVTSTDWAEAFVAGDDIIMEGAFGDGWFVTSNYTNGIAGDDHRVLLGQFTTEGILSGELFVQIFPNGVQDDALQVALPFGFASEDNEAPVFTYVPADLTMNCSAELPSEMATAEDEGCFSEAIVTFVDESSGSGCGSLVTRTFTATDLFGNTATAVQLISLTDSEAPVAVAPSDLTVNCSDDLTPGNGVAEFPTSSYDNCDTDLTYSFSDAPISGGLDLTGVTMDLHVEMGFDYGGPFGQSLILEATGVTVGEGFELDYDDLQSNPSLHRGAIAVDVTESGISLVVQGTNNSPYAYDYAHVNLTNIDGDVIAGMNLVSNGIAADSDVSFDFSSNSLSISYIGSSVYYEDASASFNLENASTCLEDQGVVRTWTVSDGCGNSSSSVQTITIVDTEGPVFTYMPASTEVDCGDPLPEIEFAVAEDCGGAASVSGPEETISAGSCGTNYMVSRMYTASDDCGNSTVYTQTIMVVDQTAPSFTSFPSDVEYTYGDEMSDDQPEATDDCNDVSITYSDAIDSGSVEITIVTRTWTATDDCGNSVSQDQIITVNEVIGCMDSDACNYNAGASYDDGSCDYCSCGAGGEAGFGLELELVQIHDGSVSEALDGLTTFRVYVTTPGSEDFVSSVSGNENVPAFLRTTTDFYQDAFGGISPDIINSFWFAVVPSLEYDSWLTVGIDSAPNFSDNESAVTFVQAPSDSWMEDFNDGGDLEINSFFGGSWFSLITSSNGYAGDDNRVLVAQLTTAGDVTGQLYVQVFPDGNQAEDTYLTLSFGGNECGCMDEAACNFSDVATYDDGTCAYPAAGEDCEGNCVSDTDGDGVCDEAEVNGCTTPTACNYNPDATDDDGSCSISPFCFGCMDETACNFESNATVDGGNCEYPAEGFDCEGNCYDWNGDLVCDVFQGCGDPTACNYDASAQYPLMEFCDFCSCANVTTTHEGYGIAIEEVESGIEGASTYRLYMTTVNSTDVLNAVLGNATNPIVLGSSSQFFQDPSGDVLPTPEVLWGFYPQIAFDSWVTIGGSENLEFPGVTEGDLPAWAEEFENGGDIVINDAVGSGWYLGVDYTSDGVAGDDNRVLMAQLTTPGTLHGQFFAQVFPEGLSAGNTLYITISFGSSSCGCTDAAACNYDSDSYDDDGSCYYASDGDSCEETCLYDTSEPTIDLVEDYTTSCLDVDSDIRQPIASDNCDDNLDFSYEDAVIIGNCAGNYSIIRNWTVTDNIGYSDSAVQTIQVVDETAPTFTVPATAEISCTDDISDLGLTGDATDMADNCSSSIEMTYSDSPGVAQSADACPIIEVITRTWTATDDCGNMYSQDQIINLVDDNAPTWTSSIPENVDLQCGDELPTWLPEAADACSGVEISILDDHGDVNCTGMAVIYRTFIAEDACGNAIFANQTITRVDTEAPMATVEDFEIGCGYYDPAVEYGSYEVLDNCMSDIAVSWTELIPETTSTVYDEDEMGDVSSDASNPTQLGTLSRGTTTITGATYNFQSVNSDPEYFTVTIAEGQRIVSLQLAEFSHVGFPEDGGGGFIGVGEGSSLPVITSPDDFYAAAQALFGGALVGFEPGNQPGDDILDDLAAPFSFFGLEIGGFNETLGAGTYTFMFKEGLEVAGPDAYTDYTLVIAVEDVDEGCFDVQREYTFTDGCGNESFVIQNISVFDNEAPIMDAVEAEVVLQCGDELPAAPGAVDNCTAATVSYADVETGLGCNGEMNFIRTYTATDECGNSVSASQDVTFIDTIAPTFTAPAHATLECDTDLSDMSATGEPMDLSDVCSASVNASYEDSFSTSEGSCLANNVVTRTWTATDGCGNSVSHVQVITLEDTTSPEVTYDESVILLDEAGEALDDFEGVEVSDACSDWTYTTTDVYVGSSISGYELERVSVFTDACGNITTIEQNITAIFTTGCTYSDAINYNDAALVDDGSCLYAGCTDMSAANYNPIASVDDDSCLTVGCMDPAGYDYDENANYPGGCDYPDACPGDINDDGLVNVGDLLEFFQFYGVDCNE